MRDRRSIYEMTDRELRSYKRLLRRQREFRRRLLSAMLTICLIAVFVISYHSLTTSAMTGNERTAFKYYTRVVVHSQETLWEIADAYMDYDQYSSKQDYIKEVCSINRLEDADSITAGQTIVVPYYSEAYVK